MVIEYEVEFQLELNTYSSKLVTYFLAMNKLGAVNHVHKPFLEQSLFSVKPSVTCLVVISHRCSF